MNNRRIVLAGGSGFIGAELAHSLDLSGFEVIVLSRSSAPPGSRIRFSSWDGRNLGEWAEHLEGAFAVVNLAGRSVNCHHNSRNRREILESRVNSVEVLGKAIQGCGQPPQVWVQAGGQGIYGDFGEGCCDENTPPGEGFLANVCRHWEDAFNACSTPRTRHALLRIGFVLGPNGGALRTLSTLTKLGLGGSVGSGTQFINWIHIADLNKIILGCIDNEDWTGVFNASGPNPVTNAGFMRELRRSLHRPWSPPAPSWAVRLGAWLMGSDGRLALTGRCAMPRKLLDAGFEFDFPELSAALNNFYR